MSTTPVPRASLRVFLFVGLAGTVVAGQPHPTPHADRDAPQSILDKAALVWTDAQDLQRSQGPYGSRSLSYKVTIGYPAPMLLTEIHSRLRRQGWKARAEDFLNPGREPSTTHVWSGGPLEEGWGEYEDGTAKPEKRIDVWQGQWDGPRSDILVYDLRYSTPMGERRISDQLRVSVIYYPREAVAALVAQTQAWRSEQERGKSPP